MSEPKKETIKIECNMQDVKEAEKAVEKLVELIKEANALVDELASKRIRLEMDI